MTTYTDIDPQSFARLIQEEAVVPQAMTVCEHLPAIDVAVSVEPLLFLERMAALADASGVFLVERHHDVLGGEDFHVVNLRWLIPSVHEEAGGQLIADTQQNKRVFVELRAARWCPNPTTRAAYCDFARQTLSPLLRVYNSVYGTRYRLRIQKPGKPYKLPSKSNRLFRRFAVLANKRSLHPFDWERFYEFARHSRTEAPAGALRGLLIEHGFAAAKANELCTLYHHLWAFKRPKRA